MNDPVLALSTVTQYQSIVCEAGLGLTMIVERVLLVEVDRAGLTHIQCLVEYCS